MKKSLIVFFLSALAIFSICFTAGQKVRAVEEVTEAGKIFFHYQLWDGDYSSSGLWTWGNGSGGTDGKVTSTVTDDFGAVYEITVMSSADEKIGIIPIKKDIDLDSRWDYRETADGYQISITAPKSSTPFIATASALPSVPLPHVHRPGSA